MREERSATGHHCSFCREWHGLHREGCRSGILIYDRIAPDYNDAYNSDYCDAENWAAAAILRRHIREYRLRNPRVIDIGCGTGLGLDLLPAGVDYVGVDPSSGMLKVARRRFPEHRFICQPIEAPGLLFETGQGYDLVMSIFGSFSHFMDPVRAIGAMARLLHPSGTVFVLTYGLSWSPVRYQVDRAVCRRWSAAEILPAFEPYFTELRTSGLSAASQSLGAWIPRAIRRRLVLMESRYCDPDAAQYTIIRGRRRPELPDGSEEGR